MLGAIAGDMAVSTFEFNTWPGDWHDIPLFASHSKNTADTVLTIAAAEAIIKSGKDEALALLNMLKCIQSLARGHPVTAYGNSFARWLYSPGA